MLRLLLQLLNLQKLLFCVSFEKMSFYTIERLIFVVPNVFKIRIVGREYLEASLCKTLYTVKLIWLVK